MAILHIHKITLNLGFIEFGSVLKNLVIYSTVFCLFVCLFLLNEHKEKFAYSFMYKGK